MRFELLEFELFELRSEGVVFCFEFGGVLFELEEEGREVEQGSGQPMRDKREA